jgi:hypothetical protein
MTIEEYREFVKIIKDYYKKDYPKEALNRAWPQIKDEPTKAIFNAVDRLMLENTNNLPPLQRVVDLVRQEGAKIRQAEIVEREEVAREEKKSFERGQERAFKEDSGIAKKTVSLVQDMLAGKKTRGEYLEGIRDLDKNFPHAGFATAGGQLKNYYENNSLPLGGKPKQEEYDDGR